MSLVAFGSVNRGSHIFDLVKSFAAAQMVDVRMRPSGWHDFLRAIATLNTSLSIAPNNPKGPYRSFYV